MIKDRFFENNDDVDLEDIWLYKILELSEKDQKM
jgi:hypothetical protein